MIHENVTPDQLDRIAEFGCAFKVTPNNCIMDGVDLGYTDYFPESVMHEDSDDYSAELSPWVPVRGYTGQYGYNGPVMHPSEFLGGKMARDVLDYPATYVVISVDDEDGEPVGWLLLRNDDE